MLLSTSGGPDDAKGSQKRIISDLEAPMSKSLKLKFSLRPKNHLFYSKKGDFLIFSRSAFRMHQNMPKT